MKLNPARATKRADQPPSTAGTSAGRARRWPLRVGVLAVGAIALAAPMVAAEPVSAPVQPTAVPASAARPVAETKAFADVADVATLFGHLTANAANEVEVTPPPPPPPTTTTTTAPPPPPPPAPAPAAGPSTGRCGGDLPPCYVMMRESGGNIRARNPSSSASGKWQFIDSTWGGFGGYSSAYLAPESVQDAKARQLWAGGAGCGHWNAC